MSLDRDGTSHGASSEVPARNGNAAGAGDPVVGTPDFRALFEAAPGRYMVVASDAPRFTILAVNDAFVAASRMTREGMEGRPLVEVFSAASRKKAVTTGMAGLQASLETVLR
ncbi:MAG TPA: hypothetical protein VHQ45_16455, partial [Gemmatimonadaceae bacterium]|nr:hypothetical protein [Gemmatimonadaceae bacterium]